MKTKITALALITATALSLAPKPAVANDKGLAIVGGFLGGLIVASAINDSRHDDYRDGSTTVFVNDRYDDRCDDRGPSGFWKEVSVQVWVPGCWIVERSHHGRGYRRYVEGHYECRTNRVWVSHNRRERHERYDRSDRDDRGGGGYSYGYGNRR